MTHEDVRVDDVGWPFAHDLVGNVVAVAGHCVAGFGDGEHRATRYPVQVWPAGELGRPGARCQVLHRTTNCLTVSMAYGCTPAQGVGSGRWAAHSMTLTVTGARKPLSARDRDSATVAESPCIVSALTRISDGPAALAMPRQTGSIATVRAGSAQRCDLPLQVVDVRLGPVRVTSQAENAGSIPVARSHRRPLSLARSLRRPLSHKPHKPPRPSRPCAVGIAVGER